MRPIERTIALGLVAVASLAAGVDQAHGQGSLSLTPWAGIYVPTRNTFQNLGATIERDNSLIVGGRLTWWGPRVLGLDLTGGYAPANVTVAGGVINGDRNTNVFVGSARLMLGIAPDASPVGFHIGAGPMLLRRGRDVTRQSQSVTEWGGVVGAGIRIPVGSSVAFRIEAEDYIYNADFGPNDQTQNDLVFSFGIAFILGAR